MILKSVIVCLFFGAIICSDLWVVTSSCEALCTILPSKASDNFCGHFDAPPSPTCESADQKYPINSKQDLPILVAMRVSCMLHQDNGESYFTWYNETKDHQVQKWKCYDTGCLNCDSEKIFPFQTQPVGACKSATDSKEMVTKGLPDMAVLYGKQSDPNKNWYQMEVKGRECKPETSRYITYSPWRPYYELAQSVVKVSDSCDSWVDVARFCGFSRCTSQNSIAVYMTGTKKDGKALVCDYSNVIDETETNVSGCKKCMQM